jgi:hypothetical protein
VEIRFAGRKQRAGSSDRCTTHDQIEFPRKVCAVGDQSNRCRGLNDRAVGVRGLDGNGVRRRGAADHQVGAFAQPAVLATLVTAIETVRAGNIRGELQDDGKALYRSNGISFLMQAHSQEKQ